jgi:hypothetical protein
MTTMPLTTTTVPSILATLISEKLTKVNYPLWSAQVLPPIRAAQLEDILLGVEKASEKHITIMVNDKSEKQRNPVYAAWMARDQAVPGYILSTLTREALLYVSRCTAAAEVWNAFAALYSSQTRARYVNTWIALITTKKNQSSVTEYFSKMSQYVDDLTASDSLLHDDEFVAYLLVGLDEEYNPVFTAIVTRVDPISPIDLYAQLLSFK